MNLPIGREGYNSLILYSSQKKKHGANGKCGCLFTGLLLGLRNYSSPFPLDTKGFPPHLWDFSAHHSWPADCNPWANGIHVIMVVPTSSSHSNLACPPERGLPCHCAVGCVRRIAKLCPTCKEKTTSTNKPLLNGTMLTFFFWKIHKYLLWNFRCLNLIYWKLKLVRK